MKNIKKISVLFTLTLLATISYAKKYPFEEDTQFENISWGNLRESIDLESEQVVVPTAISNEAMVAVSNGKINSLSSGNVIYANLPLVLSDIEISSQGGKIRMNDRSSITFNGTCAVSDTIIEFSNRQSQRYIFQNGTISLSSFSSTSDANYYHPAMCISNASVSVSNLLNDTITAPLTIYLDAQNTTSNTPLYIAGNITISSPLTIDATAKTTGRYPLIQASRINLPSLAPSIKVAPEYFGDVIYDSENGILYLNIILRESVHDTYTWNASSGHWENPLCWSGAVLANYPNRAIDSVLFPSSLASSTTVNLSARTNIVNAISNASSHPVSIENGAISIASFTANPASETRFRDITLVGNQSPFTITSAAVTFNGQSQLQGIDVNLQSSLLSFMTGTTVLDAPITALTPAQITLGPASLVLPTLTGAAINLTLCPASKLTLNSAPNATITLNVNAKGTKAGTYQIYRAPSAQSVTLGTIECDDGMQGSFSVSGDAISLILTGSSTAPASKPIIITEVQSSNDETLDDDLNSSTDWVELYNNTDFDLDISGYGLSDNTQKPLKWTFPKGTILPAHDYTVVYADNEQDSSYSVLPHAELSFSSQGETITISTPSGSKIDSITAPYLPCDTSYGLLADGKYGYFATPTPYAANTTTSYTAPLANVQFSQERGLYDAPIIVSLSHPDPTAQIYYTLSHDEPSAQNGILYDGTPIAISSTTIIRATAVKEGTLPWRNITTHSYIYPLQIADQQKPAIAAKTWSDDGSCPASYTVSENVIYDAETRATLDAAIRAAPVLSLTLTDYDLFDPQNGIHSKPSTFRDSDRAERTASVEWVSNENPDLVFGIEAGIRMQGNYSRKFSSTPKKGFRIVFRGRYGASRLEKPVLSDAGYMRDSFKSLVLRPEHNYSWASKSAYGTNMKDQFFRDLQLPMSGFNLGGNHVQLFINGLYWGLYNVAEHADEDASADRFGETGDDYAVFKKRLTDTNPDNPLIFTNYMGRLYRIYKAAGEECGLAESQEDVRNSVITARAWEGTDVDMTIRANYDEAAKFVDIPSFIDYMLLGFYSGNTDWPYNNWTATGAAEKGIPFRYYVWDFECAYLNLNDNRTHTFSTKYDFAPMYLQKALERSPEYRLQFADRIAKHFAKDGTLSINSLTNRYIKLASHVRNLIFGEAARWGSYYSDYYGDYSAVFTTNTWEQELTRLTKPDGIIAKREAVFFNQMRAIGLYPSISAPSVIDNEDGIKLQSSGQIYYTIDGSDPRNAWENTPASLANLFNGETITATTRDITLKARTLSESGEWSALTEVTLKASAPRPASNKFLPTTNGENWDKNSNWSLGTYPNAPGKGASISAPTEFKEGKGWRNIKINKSSCTVGFIDFTCGTFTNRITTGDIGGNLTIDAGTGTNALIEVLDAGLAMFDLDAPHKVILNSNTEFYAPQAKCDTNFGSILIKSILDGQGDIIKNGPGLMTIAASNVDEGTLGNIIVKQGTLAITKHINAQSISGDGTIALQLSSTNLEQAVTKTISLEGALNARNIILLVNNRDGSEIYGGCIATELPQTVTIYVTDQNGTYTLDEKRYEPTTAATLSVIPAGNGKFTYHVSLGTEPAPIHTHTFIYETNTIPTCTTSGIRTRICTDETCNYSEEPETIPPLGHIEIIDPYIPPTYTSTGLTEGKHCERCSAILVAQTEIPALKPDDVVPVPGIHTWKNSLKSGKWGDPASWNSPTTTSIPNHPNATAILKTDHAIVDLDGQTYQIYNLTNSAEYLTLKNGTIENATGMSMRTLESIIFEDITLRGHRIYADQYHSITFCGNCSLEDGFALHFTYSPSYTFFQNGTTTLTSPITTAQNGNQAEIIISNATVSAISTPLMQTTFKLYLGDNNTTNSPAMLNCTDALNVNKNPSATTQLKVYSYNKAPGRYKLIEATTYGGNIDLAIASKVYTSSNVNGTITKEGNIIYLTITPKDNGYTTTTPIPVPLSWLQNYYPQASNFEEIANSTATNNKNSVWQCYVAGLDPTNKDDTFTAQITLDENGLPQITPLHPIEGRIYTTYGTTNLKDENWVKVTEQNRNKLHFFKLEVTLE